MTGHKEQAKSHRVTRHLLFLFVNHLLFLRFLDSRVNLCAHCSGLGFDGIARVLQLLFGGGMSGTDAQGCGSSLQL
jgi:hypothetical protein